MKLFYCLLAVIFIGGTAKAQNDNKKQPLSKQTATTTPITSVSQKTITTPPVNKTDGANPTPEEQGYTKQVINGKEIYVKQQGQMIYYYEPKK